MPKAKPTPAPKPETKLVVIGTVNGQQFTAPNMDAATQAAREAAEQYKGYVNTIDSEDVKLFIAGVLQDLVRDRNAKKAELEKITGPLVNVRREALAAKQAAENLFAPYFAGSEVGERILKGELVRWDNLVTQKRLAAEAEAERKAAEERRRIEEQARLEAEEAARRDLEAQQRAQELEQQGQQAEAERIRQEAAEQLELSAEKVQTQIEEAENTQPAMVHDTSVKFKGQAVTGKWVSAVVDVKEVLAGIVAGDTPWDAVRVKVKGRLVPVATATIPDLIDGIEINLPWFADRARKETDNFNYRGMKAYFEKDIRVTA